MTEYEMVWWRHQLNGHEYEQTLGDGEGEGCLVCCSPWGHKESFITEQMKNNSKSKGFLLTMEILSWFLILPHWLWWKCTSTFNVYHMNNILGTEIYLTFSAMCPVWLSTHACLPIVNFFFSYLFHWYYSDVRISLEESPYLEKSASPLVYCGLVYCVLN